MKVVNKGILSLCSIIINYILNPFFFPQGTKELRYKCEYEAVESFEVVEVACEIKNLGNYENGNIYKVSFSDLPVVIEESIRDRISFEYFYVEENKIYKMQEEGSELHMLTTQIRELPSSILVCNDTAIDDPILTEKGWHYSIHAEDDIRLYNLYTDVVETGYYESMVWEEGKGMISFLSGYGSMRRHIELTLMEGLW